MSIFRVSVFHGRAARIFDHEFANPEDAKSALARLFGRMILKDPDLAWMPGGFAIHLADDRGRALLSLNLNATIASLADSVELESEPPPLAANMH